MPYSFIRVIIIIVIFAVVLAIFKSKGDAINRRKRVIIIISVLVFDLLLYATPFENLYKSYNTIDMAFEQTCIGEKIAVIEGQESAVVVYTTDGNALSYSLYRKNGDVWQIGSKSFSSIRFITSGKDIVTICKDSKSDEFFSIYQIVNENVEIKDNRNSTFNIIDCESFVLCCSIVNGSDKDYAVEIIRNN